jgi:hypothetical protein
MTDGKILLEKPVKPFLKVENLLSPSYLFHPNSLVIPLFEKFNINSG